MNWKTIDTAPEGVHILLWFPIGEKGVGGIECGTIYRGDQFAPDGISIWTHGGPNAGSDWNLSDAPTMWMPLPEDPVIGKDDEMCKCGHSMVNHYDYDGNIHECHICACEQFILPKMRI